MQQWDRDQSSRTAHAGVAKQFQLSHLELADLSKGRIACEQGSVEGIGMVTRECSGI